MTSSKLGGATFPLGRRFVGETMPGMRMASILLLPNIGNTPSFELAFNQQQVPGGAVLPDRAANAQAILEAFWPDACVVSASAPTPGRVLLAYEGPTRRSGRVRQTVDLRVCSSQGYQLSPTSWVGADVYVQDNIEQGVRTNYLVAQQLRLLDSGVVASTQRVASFLQPTDSLYFDALGKPVALFDYDYQLKRIAKDIALGNGRRAACLDAAERERMA